MNLKKFFLPTAVMAFACGLFSGLLTVKANAATCAPRDVVVERLAERYGESRQSIGLGANNAVVEVFASQETGTWTITVTSVHGLTCLVASGQSFETLDEPIPAEGNDA